MRRKWILISLSAVVLLPVLLLVAVLFYLDTADLSQHRDVIAEQVSKFAGRELSLGGELDLNISMTPSIVITDIALANASWASEPEMLTIQRVDAEIDLSALLHGDIHILRFHVEGVKSLLETNSDGVSNWVLAKPGDADVVTDEAGKTGELKLPWIGDAFIGEVEFIYHNGQSGQRVTAKLDHARVSAAKPESPIELDIVGQVNNNPVEINGKLALPAVLATGSMDIPIELHATVLDLKADATGTITGAAESPAVDLSVQANAANLDELRKVFGDVVPQVQPVKLVMDVKADQGQPLSFKLNVIAGKGKLDTQLTLRRDGPRPSLTGKVDIKDVDVERLWAPLLAGKSVDSSATKAQTPPLTSSHQFDQAIALDWLEAFDADIALSTKNINLPQLHIKSLQNRFIVDDRSLKLDGLKLTTDAGSVMAQLHLNARGKRPELQLDLNTTVIALGKLQPLAANKRLAHSNAEAVISLTAQGETVAALIESLQGNVQLDYNDKKRKEKLSINLTRKPEVKGDQQQPVSIRLNAVAGKGKLDTQLTLRREGPRPKLIGSVDISDVDVERLWASLVAGEPDKASATKAHSSPSTTSQGFDQPIPVAWLNTIDADVVLSANNIKLPQARIKSLHSRFIIDDRNLKIDEMKLSTDAGSVMAQLHLNARGKQPDIHLDLNTTTVALARLQLLAANKRLANSTAKAAITLAAQGGTVAGLIKSLQGNVQLDYNDQKRKEKLSISLTRKPEKKSTDRPRLVVAASGRIDGQPIELSGTIIPPAGFLLRTKPYEINLALQAFGVTGKVTGTAADPYTLNGINLAIEAQAADLAGLRQAFGQSVPTIGKTNLSTRLTMQQSKLRLSKLHVGLGDGRIEGWLVLNTAASIPDLQADLTFSDLNLDKLLPAEEKQAEPEAKPAAKTADDKLFSDAPLPFESLSRANVKATLRASNLVRNNRHVKDAEIKLDLAGGKLSVDLIKLASVEGELEGVFEVDASGNKTPAVMIKLKAPKLDLGELLASGDVTTTIEGPLAVDIFLQGQGNSMAEIMGTLDGKIHLLMEHGSADAKKLDMLVGGLSAMFGTIFTDQSSKTRINCAISDLTLNDGMLTPQLAVLDTEYSTVFAEGQVDLKNEQLDIKVSPAAKGVTLSVAVPVRLHGRLSEPGIELEKAGALLMTGRLWASVVYPPAALLEFNDLGGGKQNPCVSMVAEKGGMPILDGVGKVVGGVVKGAEGAVKGVGTGLGKIFDSEKDTDSTTATENDVDEEDDFYSY